MTGSGALCAPESPTCGIMAPMVSDERERLVYALTKTSEFYFFAVQQFLNRKLYSSANERADLERMVDYAREECARARIELREFTARQVHGGDATVGWNR